VLFLAQVKAIQSPLAGDFVTAIPMNEAALVSERTPSRGMVRFRGDERTYWRLMMRGSVLLLLTLGIYRFWLATDQRHFLWSNTELAGQSFEYNGTALELLLGFLIAIAIIVPLNAAILFFAVEWETVELASVLAFVQFALFGPFAIFRARRYRLTRTVFRGIRFHQTGSALRYALYVVLWWIVIALTLGLAYPWAQASLERYKMRNTYYGDLRGGFEGAGWRLFARGVGLWVLVVGPFIVVGVMAVMSVDWSAVTAAAAQGGDVVGGIEGINPEFYVAIVLMSVGLAWLVLSAALLYPAFQALMLRWWTGGLRFGGLELDSRLRTSQVYRAYLRFVGYALLLFIAVAVAFGLFVYAGGLAGIEQDSASEQILNAILSLAAYVTIALGSSVIYQVTVKLGLWRLAVDALDLSGLGALEGVKAAGGPASPLGEGLADALNVGGL
jgi:uncharacterized membrane protein YjgN (DUF898 family)